MVIDRRMRRTLASNAKRANLEYLGKLVKVGWLSQAEAVAWLERIHAEWTYIGQQLLLDILKAIPEGMEVRRKAGLDKPAMIFASPETD